MYQKIYKNKITLDETCKDENLIQCCINDFGFEPRTPFSN